MNTKKRSSTKRLNIFAEGGDMSGIINGGINVINAGLSNAKTNDTKPLEQQINQIGNYQSKATTNDDIMKEWSSFNPLNHVGFNDVRGGSTSSRLMNTLGSTAQGAATGSMFGPIGTVVGGAIGLGSGIAGWITGDSKAKRQQNALNAKIDLANQRNVFNMENKVSNIDNQNDLRIAANYSAYGGLLDTMTPSIDYLGDNDYSKVLKALNDSKIGSISPQTENMFSKGGMLDLGTYLNLYGEGGNLNEDIPDNFQHGGTFDNGVILIQNGGTHEENPLTGIPMGLAPDGKPNLVEEGEVKYNDYIFSNRLSPDKKLIEGLHLPSNYSNKTFAKIAEDINKESSERPNDPISKNGLIDSMNKLQVAQELIKSMKDIKSNKNKKAYGGHLYDKGGNVPFALDLNENLQQEYPYINNNPLELPLKLMQYKGYNNNVDDRIRIGNNILPQKELSQIPYIQAINQIPVDVKGVQLPQITDQSKSSVNSNNTHKFNMTDLRYAPVVGAGIASITDTLGITNKPNNNAANMIGALGDKIPEVQYTPVGNYLSYNPLDRDYYINKMNAQSAATRRQITNSSGGNRANAQANLLAADYNYNQGLGNLARQAEEYNLNQRQQVEGFNRGTNQFNSQQALQAAQINRGNDQLRVKAKMMQAELMQAAQDKANAARMTNFTNLVQSLGELGREKVAENMINTNPALLWKRDDEGNNAYKKAKGGSLKSKC